MQASKQRRVLAAVLLRSAPALLPLVAVLAAVLGLSSALNAAPTVDNLAFVILATLLCGIVGVCISLGLLFLLADVLWPARRRALVIAVGVLACAIAGLGFAYGRALDF